MVAFFMQLVCMVQREYPMQHDMQMHVVNMAMQEVVEETGCCMEDVEEALRVAREWQQKA